MQVTNVATPSSFKPVGTGGFLDPEVIVEHFGVQEGMKIADFGCGSGYFTIILAQKTGPEGRVYALDILESALDHVMSKARANKLDNIEAVRANLEVAESSSLSDSSQDVVLLANILFQSNQKERIIKEGSRVLKKNGRIIIIDWRKGTGGFGPPDDLRASEDDIKKIAESAGLSFDGDIDASRFHFGLRFAKL